MVKKRKRNKIKKDLSNQMKMFEEGGLKEEGGMVDEVSGNDVPIGSTREEVRDDIPAQLSEGEFVFPADVVRFIGLEKLMEMRQEAKAGLKRMEEMGQMGNSEEATLPDDIPFDMEDLDIEEQENEEEGEVTDSNFNQGGVVTMAKGGTTPTIENKALKYNIGGTTEKPYGDFYRFKMPGVGTPNNFTQPFTKEGKQYYGFRPLPDGKIAAFRKSDKVDPDTGESRGNEVDVLEANTKFSMTNPQTDIDPPRRSPMTVSEMANIKDGTVVSRYQPIPNQVYYKGFREYRNTIKSPKKTEPKLKQPIATTTMDVKKVAEPIKTTNTFTPMNNISQTAFTPTITQQKKEDPKETSITPKQNSFIKPTTDFALPSQQRALPKQTPLNVRQQQVPMRGMVTNIPKAEDFLKRKTDTVGKTKTPFTSVPINTGSRFTNILEASKKGLEEKRKSINDVQQDINTLTSYTLDDYGDNEFDDSGGVKSGGLDYSTVDRFALNDDLRDVFNDFSKAQLSMFSVATSDIFTTIASGIGTSLANKTGGATAFGPINKAEMGKIQATAFHQTALEIQNKYGLQNVNNINNWTKEAQNDLAKQGRVRMDFAKDIYNASIGQPYSAFSFNEKDKKGFLDTAKNFVSSVLNMEKNTTSMPTPEIAAKQKGMANLMSTIKTLASKSQVTKQNQDMINTIKDAIQLDDEAAFGGYDVNNPSSVDLDGLGFNNNALGDISANGGSKGIGYNSNGTAYSINNNGTYTHFNGTTTNATDSKGNPVNPPPTPKQDDNNDYSAPPSIDTGKGIETIDYNDYSSYNDSNDNNNDSNDSNDNSSGAGAESGVGGWT